MLSHNVSLIKSETFTSFLIRCHLIVIRSSDDFSDFNHVRFRTLGQLAEVLYIEHAGVLSAIAVIFSVRANSNGLLGHTRLFITIAKRNSACFDHEILLPLIELVGLSSELAMFYHVLELIQALKGSSMKARVAHLSLLFFQKGIELEAGFLDIICIQSLFMKPPSFFFSVEPEADPFWYFWPVVVLLDQKGAEDAIAALLSTRSESYSEILSLLALFQATCFEMRTDHPDAFVRVCATYDLSVISDPVPVFNRLQDSWNQGKVANFDYLPGLSLING
jgi:hypothetical protein